MKIYNYTVFMALMIILFLIAGFQFTFTSSVLRDFGLINSSGVLDPTGVQTSTFFLALKSLFGVALVGGLIIGTAAGFNFSFILRGMFMMTILTGFVGDMISILALPAIAGTWVFWIIAIILIPLIAGYGVALAEWWDNHD